MFLFSEDCSSYVITLYYPIRRLIRVTKQANKQQRLLFVQIDTVSIFVHVAKQWILGNV